MNFHNIGWGRLVTFGFIAIMLGVGVFSACSARAFPVEATPVYETVPTYKTVKECSRSSGGTGDVLLGGLIGSAIGNGLTSADGAGTAGAVIGALIGSEPKERCSTREVYTGSYERLIGYNVTIDNYVYFVPREG